MEPVGLIGYPVAHSLSPAIHNAALEALGLSYRYALWPTPPEELQQRLAGLRDRQMLGANVTMPHKQAVVPYLDRLEGAAEILGAVNTIVRQEGELIGLNTDLPALLAELAAVGYDPGSGAALILGAGGAARVAAWALLEAGAPAVFIANRTPQRAEEVLADLLALREDEPTLVAYALDDLDGLREATAEARLLINASSAGWQGELPIDPAVLHRDLLVYDLIYRHTPLLEHAERTGARSLDGLGMLVRQAALALERWIGQPAPLEVMFQAARRST